MKLEKFQRNSNCNTDDSKHHRDNPFKHIMFDTRNAFFDFRFKFNNLLLKIRLNFVNFGIKIRLNLINFTVKFGNLFTSSKNREVKVSGLKKGFNEHFSLFFIKATFLKTFNVFVSIKSFIMHSNLFVFHKKVSSVIRNSCSKDNIDIEINLEESNICIEAHRWYEVIRFGKNSGPTCKRHCDELKNTKPLLQIIVIILMLACNIEKAISEPCVGKFVNPIKDICWSCIFPVKLGNTAIYSGGREDTDNPSNPVCICPADIGAGVKVPMPGLAISFWEPVRLADVTRTPYCMVSLGGFQIMKSAKKHGTVARKSANESLKHSFYHVHYYIYPLIYWLELLTDFICLEEASVDVAYISEFDPLWGNDKLNMILNPEAVLFGNPIAQMACIFDCMKASVGFSSDMLFHCAGCNGSLYPFGGSVEHTQGGVQASSLIVERLLARLHRVGLAWDTVSDSCEKSVAPKVKKTQYKLQMTYPVPNTSSVGKMECNPFGRTSAIWGAGKEIPGNGEDFGYLIWRKRYCCFQLLTELALMKAAG